VQVLMTSYKY